jgi:hypothetical protein
MLPASHKLEFWNDEIVEEWNDEGLENREKKEDCFCLR